ncbi:MAG: hypothetical protein HQM16_01995 [Deltaproteobacteria bacterium]|nr:hypothetical protein [Deltaproteobacteria bacterium]
MNNAWGQDRAWDNNDQVACAALCPVLTHGFTWLMKDKIKMKNQRKRLLVLPSLQIKFIMTAVLLFWLPIMVLSVIILNSLNDMLDVSKAADMLVKQSIASTATLLSAMLFIAVPVLTAAIIYLVYVFTSQIVGPVYRIEADIDKFLSNPTPTVIVLRKKDAFHSLAARINLLLQKIEPVKVDAPR